MTAEKNKFKELLELDLEHVLDNKDVIEIEQNKIKFVNVKRALFSENCM
jgi:hypothetical protein